MPDPNFEGKTVSHMLEKFNSGDSLNDMELKVLSRGLDFLVGFNSHCKMTPLTYYYANKLTRVNEIQDERKAKK